ncbi:MAG: cobyrinate a,c-diamide synthase [unclassified Hahellaceae]|nr:cobyrinate a,c-diamide synthase [Hahellaceae bacterium]|tara:strand:+ start:2719 stop:4062 length:1344 start_codon:yes stop_codon:yes gene_type:complete
MLTTQRTRITGTTAAALICAPGSGHGKSMVTAAMARLHRNAGRSVRVFKHGPDYLDPMVLELASGAPVYQVHGWMTGDEEIRWRLAEAARDVDLVLVEGSMGLFDGEPCSADLAVSCGIPALPVIDARAMGQTFGALALGLASYRPDVKVHEVIANRVGSAYHTQLVGESLPPGISLLGAIPRSEFFTIPDRHLGLVQASELPELDAALDAAAEVLKEAGLDRLPAQVTLSADAPLPIPRLLTGRRIAIARDNAFAFIYPANLDVLRSMGAELTFFSPLTDQALPACDAIWLPGGYPELHGKTLSGNTAMRAAIRAHHSAGKPILAECGGLMACVDSLLDTEGVAHAMYGLMPGQARMAGRLKGLGMQAMAGSGDSAHEELRGHAYHHSDLDTPLAPAVLTRRLRGSAGEAIYRQGSLTASYFHGYFPSAPQLIADLFNGRAVAAGH